MPFSLATTPEARIALSLFLLFTCEGFFLLVVFESVIVVIRAFFAEVQEWRGSTSLN